MKNGLRHLARDALIIAGSVIVALVLSKNGAIETITKIGGEFTLLSSFIAGIFFTSIFTVAPAGVGLVALGATTSPTLVAAMGALGACLTDFVLVSFVRKDISEDLQTISQFAFKRHFIRAFHFGFFKWLSLLIGLFFVATPLPDELGLFFLGISKIPSWLLLFIFYTSHFLGIWALLTIAQSVAL